MLEAIWTFFGAMLERGGWAMWPLLGFSIIAITLIFERIWFWVVTNSPGRVERYQKVAKLLREGKPDQVQVLIENDETVYGHIVKRLIDEPPTDALVTEVVESQRSRLERFMTPLGTIITAAPMLGILGTVTGLMQSTGALGATTESVTDATRLAGGISEALITTATGLVIAIIVLVPFNGFRARIDRTLGRLESLIAAARQASPITEITHTKADQSEDT